MKDDYSDLVLELANLWGDPPFAYSVEGHLSSEEVMEELSWTSSSATSLDELERVKETIELIASYPEAPGDSGDYIKAYVLEIEKIKKLTKALRLIDPRQIVREWHKLDI